MISEGTEVLVNIKKLYLQTIPLVIKFIISLTSMLGNSMFELMALTEIINAEKTAGKMKYLTLKPPIPQNGQTHSNNSSATADKLFECVSPFCKLGA